MFHLRKFLAAATLATVALLGAPGQQAQATTVLNSNQIAVIGEDYTFNTTLVTSASVPIGPVAYAFTFTPATANALITAAFTYVQLTGTFTGGYLSWSDGVSAPVTAALVAGAQTTLAIPLSAAGPNQKLTVGFTGQSGIGVLTGIVLADKDDTVSTIPLPASGLLLLAGLGAITAVRRRAAKRAA